MIQLKTKADTLILDYGDTLILDPFFRILKMKSNEFRELLHLRGYTDKWQRLFEAWAQTNKNIDYPFISHFYQEENIIEQALKNIGIHERSMSIISQDLLRIYRQGFKEVLTKDNRRIEVKKTLNFFKKKGFKLGVLSNERQFALEIALTFYGILDSFDLVLSSERVGVEKPDAEVFYHMLSTLKSKPETTIFVGDDPIRDILAAKKIGMITVLYIPPPEHSEEMPWRSRDYSRIKADFVTNRFTDLKQIV